MITVEDKFNETLQSEIRNLTLEAFKINDLTTLLIKFSNKIFYRSRWDMKPGYRIFPTTLVSTATILFTKTAHINQAGVLDCTCQTILIAKTVTI